MAKRFATPQEWIDDCRSTVKADFDNLMLFTGPEGSGKSTLAFQILRAIDPTFTVARVQFGIRNFLAAAPETPRYRAVLADELEANKRRGMSGATLDLLDFLKDCRGLNLHMAICFPHEDLFEGAILNFRVRWKIHVPRRGLWILSERTSRQYRKRSTGELVTIYQWHERGRWTFKENSGPLWDDYRAKKEAHMRSLGERYREEKSSAGNLGGVDHGRAVDYFARALGSVDEKKAGAGASIHEAP